MRQPLRRNQQRAQAAGSLTIPAPIKGLNSRDPLPAMEPDYALILDNVFPDATSCRIRRGYQQHAMGMPGAVRTLIQYTGLTGAESLFAASGGNIYNVTAAGAVGAPASSGYTSNDWQYVGFTNAAGAFTIAANGVDTPIRYDGAAWAALAINPTGAGSPTSNAFIGVTSHKNRLWFIAENHLSAWYLGTDAISGNAPKFALSSVFELGGKLVGIGTLSSDAAVTLDDYLCFVSDQGEVAIYQGTDPASSSSWGLVQLVRIAEPIGRRCTINLNGDLIILTTDGAISLKSAIQYDRASQDSQAVTSVIRRTFSEVATAYRANFGWQQFIYPDGRWFLINVPEAVGARQIQYVMNITTGAWGRFNGMNGNCWGLLNGRPYFGGNSGVVYAADTGFTDNGVPYTADLKTAFSYLGAPGRQKRVTTIRPLLRATNVPPYGIKLNFDFNDSGAAVTSMMVPAGTVGIWNQGQWNVNTWGGVKVYAVPTGVSGVGNAAAVRFTANISGQELEVLSFDLVAEAGGFL